MARYLWIRNRYARTPYAWINIKGLGKITVKRQNENAYVVIVYDVKGHDTRNFKDEFKAIRYAYIVMK